MYKIFIIEDDYSIAQSIKKHIESFGCDVLCANEFKNILDTFTKYQPHLILLDISLPYMGGYYWCTEIRKLSNVPIIFISSASDNMNIVMAMNAGGDDFIPKPFDLNVLTAKLQAMLRRSYDFIYSPSILEHKGVTINTNDTSLTYNGKRLELTKNDYRIITTLMECKGKIVSRDALMEKLWETDSYVDENTFTVNITRLRKKLEGIGICNFILTKKGLGYIIEI